MSEKEEGVWSLPALVMGAMVTLLVAYLLLSLLWMSCRRHKRRSSSLSASSLSSASSKSSASSSSSSSSSLSSKSSASSPSSSSSSRSKPCDLVLDTAHADQNRPRTKGGNGLKSGQPPDVVSTSARGSRAQEVARLESLCEARTKELNYTKMQLKAGLQGFDALACLLNYCTTELDAFSCPAISAQLKIAQAKLTEQQQSLDRVSQEKGQVEQQLQEVTAARDAARQEVEKLQQQLKQAEETHNTAQQQLKEEHCAALKTLQEELTSQHQQTIQEIQKHQDKQAEYTRHSQKRRLSELTSEHQMATNQLKLAHLEEIQELRNKHELQIAELHVQQRKKLDDITQRFESIKLSLTEKVQSLCGECDDLRVRAKASEEALQRDSDVKVQLALTPYLQLPKEIESLKTVIDMRTEEIQKLRRQNMDLVKQLEELPIAQEKVAALQQKVENLQAIINIKTDHEKQLHEKCQVLMRKYDRESRANKRLSMDYEQVVWRMSQSADFTGSTESVSPRQLSRSPSRGDQHSHGSSPARSLSSSSQGGDSNGVVVRRHRKGSAGDDNSDHRRRANTFSSDTSKHKRSGEEGDSRINGPSSSGKQRVLSKSGDYSDLVKSAKEHEESFSSGHESGDMSDFYSSLESNVILETAQGVSFHVVDKTATDGVASQEEVFMEEMLNVTDEGLPADSSLPSDSMDSQTEVTVVITSPTSK